MQHLRQAFNRHWRPLGAWTTSTCTWTTNLVHLPALVGYSVKAKEEDFVQHKEDLQKAPSVALETTGEGLEKTLGITYIGIRGRRCIQGRRDKSSTLEGYTRRATGMGQRLAKKDMEEGLRLYNEQRFHDAVKLWRRALKKLDGRRERFIALGYLAAAHGDAGRFRDMLAFAVQQIDLANDADSGALRAEAYLNLARSNERLCEYHKAASYCRHALQHAPSDPRVPGYVHLTLAQAYFGFSNFSRALDSYDQALRVAQQHEDPPLELQVYSGLGILFTTLKDYDKGLAYHVKAAELAKSFKICDFSSRFHRMTTFNMAHPYRKMGKLDEAMECCEDALKMALAENDRLMQARCLCCFADIYRRKNDIQRAYPRYEAAINILAETGDRYGQIDVLAGMAKTMVLMRQLAKVCECKALEYNSKALDLSHSIGNKMHQLRCHLRMQELYRSLDDDAMTEESGLHVRRLLADMDLFCGVCNKAMGDKSDRLEALQCCHLVHARCSSQLTRSSAGRRGSRVINCSKCRKTLQRTPGPTSPTNTANSGTTGSQPPGTPSSVCSLTLNPLPHPGGDVVGGGCGAGHESTGTGLPGMGMGMGMGGTPSRRISTVSCDPNTGVVSSTLGSSHTVVHGNPVYL